MDVVVDGRVAAVEELLVDFGRWLSTERAVASETVRCYRSQARKFLVHLPAPLSQALADLDAAAVTGYVVEYAAVAGSVESAKAHVTALRSLLRFLHVHGRIGRPLRKVCSPRGVCDGPNSVSRSERSSVGKRCGMACA